jgi:hypothetical protein
MPSSGDGCIVFQGSTTSISLEVENDAFVHIGIFFLKRTNRGSYLELFHVVVLEESVVAVKEDESEQTNLK